MKQCVVAGLATVLMAGGLIAVASPASAGCQYGGLVISKCDGPVQLDGTRQRCVVFDSTGTGLPSYLHERRCDLMGPELHPWGFAFADPPTHIDDPPG
ncbi:MAG: CDGP domain-containing protein [Mycobacterium sp.]